MPDFNTIHRATDCTRSFLLQKFKNKNRRNQIYHPLSERVTDPFSKILFNEASLHLLAISLFFKYKQIEMTSTALLLLTKQYKLF